MSAVLRLTLCRLGRHCRPENGEKKFDGGRRSLLCRHCRRVIGWWS
jgi:hypothetical protein